VRQGIRQQQDGLQALQAREQVHPAAQDQVARAQGYLAGRVRLPPADPMKDDLSLRAAGWLAAATAVKSGCAPMDLARRSMTPAEEWMCITA
jgi:hypothetical protein